MNIATKRIGLAALALVVGMAGSARADLLAYNGGLPDFVNPGGLDMTANNVVGSFSFGPAATVTDIRFWSIEGDIGFTGTLTWSIYRNDGGTVGATVASGSTSSVSHVDLGNGFFDNDFSVGSLGLEPGYYWLGLHNGPLSFTGPAHMFWAKGTFNNSFDPTTGAPYYPQAYPLADGGPWGTVYGLAGPSLALYGNQGVSVPEPSTLMVSGTVALLGLGLAWRHRQAA